MPPKRRMRGLSPPDDPDGAPRAEAVIKSSNKQRGAPKKESAAVMAPKRSTPGLSPPDDPDGAPRAEAVKSSSKQRGAPNKSSRMAGGGGVAQVPSSAASQAGEMPEIADFAGSSGKKKQGGKGGRPATREGLKLPPDSPHVLEGSGSTKGGGGAAAVKRRTRGVMLPDDSHAQDTSKTPKEDEPGLGQGDGNYDPSNTPKKDSEDNESSEEDNLGHPDAYRRMKILTKARVRQRKKSLLPSKKPPAKIGDADELSKLEHESQSSQEALGHEPVEEEDKKVLLPSKTPATKIGEVDELAKLEHESQSSQEALGHEQRKTGKKSQTRFPGFSQDTYEATPVVSNKDKTDAFQDYKEAKEIVDLINYSLEIQRVKDITEIKMPSNPTPLDLLRFAKESLEEYLRVCPLAIPVIMNGKERQIPVTPAKPKQIEYTSHHILALTRAADKAIVKFLIEQFSNYMKAFKVVLSTEKKTEHLKPWIILGLGNTLPSRFSPVRHIKCDIGYVSVEKVFMHKYRIPDIVDFFISFDVPKPEEVKVTDEDKVKMDNSFVCFCEFIRIAVIKDWTLEGVTRERENPLKFPIEFPALLRDWKVLGKLILTLYLAILEAAMLARLPDLERADSPFNRSMPVARDMWRKRQIVQKAIAFFSEDAEIDENKREMILEWLCGSNIILIRHHRRSFKKAFMRYIDYPGHWRKDINDAFDKKKDQDKGVTEINPPNSRLGGMREEFDQKKPSKSEASSFSGGISVAEHTRCHTRMMAKFDEWDEWEQLLEDEDGSASEVLDEDETAGTSNDKNPPPPEAPDKVFGAVDSNALVLANSSHGNVIKGLPNLGNTCFFNAVLQSLLALDMFRSEMLGLDVPMAAIAMSLRKLFIETSASNDAVGALSPKCLFSSICSKYPQFNGNQMQDSHELLRCFLDGLSTEETEAGRLAEGSSTIVESLFGGQLSSTVSSTECAHGSVKYDQFLDLSLQVPSKETGTSANDEVDDSSSPVSVQGCLALYTETEELSDSWHCEHCSIAIVDTNDSQDLMPSGDDKEDGDEATVRCNIDEITATDGCIDSPNPPLVDADNTQRVDKTKVFRAAMRRILISKAPQVLTITLKRFSQDSHGLSTKLEGHVRFTEMLDIRPFMDPRFKGNENNTYRLAAVVEHKGSTTCGHYVAHVRSGKIGGRQQQSSASSSWFCASDLDVRKTSLEEILRCEAYILFYERMTDQDGASS